MSHIGYTPIDWIVLIGVSLLPSNSLNIAQYDQNLIKTNL